MQDDPLTINADLLIERHRTLLQVSEAIAAHRDLTKLFRDLAQRLPRVVDVNFVGLSLHDSERNVMRLHTLQANVPADIVGGHECPVDDSPGGVVWRTQQPLLVPDLAEERRWSKVTGLMREDGINSFCEVPLTTAVRRLGAMGFASLKKGAYGKADVEFLKQVGKQVAVAVDNVLHHEDLSHDRDRLRLLLEVSESIASHRDLDEWLHDLSQRLPPIVPFDYINVVLHDSAREVMRLHILAAPESSTIRPGLELPVDESPGGLVWKTQQPLMVEDVALETRFPKLIPMLRENGVQSFCAVPLTTALRRLGAMGFGSFQKRTYQEAELNNMATESKVCERLLDEGVKSLCSIPLLAHDRVLGALNVGRLREDAFVQDDIDLLSQVAQQVAIAVENALAYRKITELKDKLAKEKLYLEEEIRTEQNFEEIIGESSRLKQVLKQVEIVAPTDSTVLIQGETGTGKELIARAIHNLSGRRERTFVKMNCAAIPTGLLESELFGHERGAVTGAIASKVGRLELADQGTLFLDEVGDIPLEVQPKLLRALQEREFERLGSTRTKKVDVRLVAATNRDLEKMIETREFRSDLYYRLNVFPIRIPPLRERPEDIPLLVRYFDQKYVHRMEKQIESIPAAAMKKLTAWHWPGNIRELENFIERSVILTRGPALQVPIGELGNNGKATPIPGTREADERDGILRILKDTNGRVAGPNGAAGRMGIKRTTLISRMKNLGIDPRRRA